MTPEQLKQAEERMYFYRTKEDDALYSHAVRGLQGLSPGEPYHCGPHNVRCFRYAIREAFRSIDDPEARIFEVGFNLGYSAALMLALGAERVHSIDIRGTPKMRQSAQWLKQEHGDRISVQLNCTVASCAPPPFTPTLCYIDGGHDYKDVKADVLYCRDTLQCTHFLFDDWPPFYGPGVQPVVREMGLLPLAIVGSMAFCVVPKAAGYYNPF